MLPKTSFPIHSVKFYERIKKHCPCTCLFLLGNRVLAPGIGIVTLDLGSELSILVVLENQLGLA